MRRTATRRLGLIVIIVAIVAALIAAIVYAIPGGPEAGPAGISDPAVLTIFSGHVSVLTERAGEWSQASDGARLDSGDRVKTGADSYALITFFDGSTFELDPETDVSIVRVDSTEDGATIVKLKQWLGRTMSRVERLIHPDSSYEVETLSAIAAARGTLIDVEVKRDATSGETITIASAFEGVVALAGQEQEVLLEAGKEAYVRDDERPSPPLPVALPMSQLKVSVGSSVLLQLIDPVGRSAGIVPPDIEVNQIPKATTGGSLGKPQVVELNEVADGEYAIVLYAQEDDTASLRVEGISHDMVEFDETLPLQLEKGHNYRIPLQVMVEEDLLTQLELGEAETITEDVAGKVVIVESMVEREVDLNADFAADDTVVTAGQSVQFSDLSSGDVSSWLWDFGDGQSSNEQNPRHTYASAGTYSVSLVVSDAASSHEETKFVTAYDRPEADFEVEFTEATVGQVIWFEDKSTGNPGEWLWDFGDGQTSNERYPSHSYADIGTYTVSLTVTNAAGSSSVSKEQHVIGTETYTLTTSVDPPDSGTVSPAGGSYLEGTEVTIAAAAAPGYRFVRWSVDNSSRNNPLTITMDSNKSITANFVDDSAPVTYNLNVGSSEGGSVTEPGEGEFTYTESTVVPLVAEASSDYLFANWTGNVGTVGNSVDLEDLGEGDGSQRMWILHNKSVLEDSETIYINGVEQTKDTDYTIAYDSGRVTFTLAPDDQDAITASYYYLDATLEEASIIINGDYEITANFVSAYALTVAIDGSGSASPEAGEHKYSQVAVVTITATPDSGYEFDGWTGDVDDIEDPEAASTTITLNGDRSITAVFSEIPPDAETHILTMQVEGNGSTSPEAGEYEYAAGAQIPLMAGPDDGWLFYSWTGDVSTVADVGAMNTTITMNDDYSITANFTMDGMVTFPDENLEAAIRNALAQPTGLITKGDLAGLTGLSAGDRGITDLTGLEHCGNLIWLYIPRNDMSDLSPLSSLPSLMELYVSYSEVSDLSPLSSIATLAYLELGHTQVSDISPLSSLPNLTHLGLDHTQISDFSVLSSLTNLTYLDLISTGVSDLSLLSSLGNLTDLYLGFNQISDISALSSLTNLTGLGLNSNEISDISSLSSLTSLTDLRLESNQIGDISPLSSLTRLTRLVVESNQISDIKPLVDNTGLSNGDKVYLWDNPLSDTSISTYIPQLRARGVDVFTHGIVAFPDDNLEAVVRDALDKPTGEITADDLAGLTGLSAGDKGITDLAGLEHCSNLIWLYIPRNDISDLSPLSSLPSLMELYVSYSEVSDLSPLSSITTLAYLELGHTQVSDISPLSSLPNLTRLQLDHTQISDFSVLSSLTNLTYLDLISTGISELSLLSSLNNLEHLHLDFNQITDISALSSLENLMSLDLSNNQIGDIKALVDNPGLANGDSIYLEGNPLSDTSISVYIPQLQARGVNVQW